ncbi:Com family DNA-binding transcriptional regulator [Vulcaniibacterium tengchongense]|uniref:Com family DNA-binding transcriptional regulator n=1 Tax=Vulcaniibacterium tengchongense TaxID=1273429 RepID=UPI001F548E4C|nr:Com family DNA-binding transcriptional regulator [Vulcaniibacterium tengchongense]
MRVVLLPVRCGECARLLAKAAQFAELQIKCPRCGTLNHLKAASLPTDRRERYDEGSIDGEPVVAGRRPEVVADA